MSTRKHTLTILLGLISAAALFVSQAQAQFAPEDYETAVGAGTYLDLTDDPAGTTRNGTTMIWSNHTPDAWEFPDGSDGSEFVNSNSADDKGDSNLPSDTPEIDLDFSGLLASTPYNIYLAARYRGEGNDEGGDISWGTMSGSLNLVQFNEVMFPPGSVLVNSDTDSDGTLLLKVGSLSSDGSGALNFLVDNGLDFNNTPDEDPLTLAIGRNRTQFDGVLLSVVPEPGSVVLGMFAAVSLLATRRRRANRVEGKDLP